MPNARQMIIAALPLSGLILSGQAKADDFVVMPRHTNSYPAAICLFKEGSPFKFVDCQSHAYVFNKDTSDIYACDSRLHWTIKADGSLAADEISASCTKKPKVFASISKYTFLGESEYVPIPPNLQHGDALWVSENTALHVKACFFTTNSVTVKEHFECADATVN
jgi:hypothetical protein